MLLLVFILSVASLAQEPSSDTFCYRLFHMGQPFQLEGMYIDNEEVLLHEAGRTYRSLFQDSKLNIITAEEGPERKNNDFCDRFFFSRADYLAKDGEKVMHQHCVETTNRMNLEDVYTIVNNDGTTKELEPAEKAWLGYWIHDSGIEAHRVLDKTNTQGYLVTPTFKQRTKFIPLKLELELVGRNQTPKYRGLRLETDNMAGGELTPAEAATPWKGFELFGSLPVGFIWLNRVYVFDFVKRRVFSFQDSLESQKKVRFEQHQFKHFFECTISSGTPSPTEPKVAGMTTLPYILAVMVLVVLLCAGLYVWYTHSSESVDKSDSPRKVKIVVKSKVSCTSRPTWTTTSVLH